MKSFTSRFILYSLLLLLASSISRAALPNIAVGDYRSQGDVNIATTANWNVCIGTSGGGVWQSFADFPPNAVTVTNIWIQSGHRLAGGNITITNLCVSTGTGTGGSPQSAPGQILIGNAIITITGSIHSYYGPVAGTGGTFGTRTATTGLTNASYNLTSNYSTSAGYLRFTGSTPTVAGSWSNLGNSIWTAYFDRAGTITMGASFSCAVLGTSSASGLNLTFPSGTTFTLTGTNSCFINANSTITIDQGGTWDKFGGTSIGIHGNAQGTYAINGTMNFSGGAQHVPPNVTVGTTGTLILSNSGTKTINANNLTIYGKLSFQGTTVATGSFPIIYGSASTLEYKGSAQQTVGTIEWPVSGTIAANGSLPARVDINNASGVKLTASSAWIYPGTINFTTGCVTIGVASCNSSCTSLTLSNSTFASQVTGSYNTTNYFITAGAQGGVSDLTRNGNPASATTYFIGTAAADCTPVIITPDDVKGITVSVAPLALTVIDATKCVNKQWIVKSATNPGTTATVELRWNSTADEGASFISAGGHTSTDLGVQNTTVSNNWIAVYSPIASSLVSGSIWHISKSALTLPYASTNNVLVVGAVDQVALLPTVSVNSPSSCNSAGVDLTASCSGYCTGIAYQWTPATGLSATTGATVTATTSVTTTYTVTGTVTGGATSTAVATVTVVTTDAPAISVSNICGSSTLSTTATGTLLWSYASATTSSITVTTSGTYTLTQTLNYCTSAASSATVTVNTVPTTYSVTGGGNYCSGSGIAIGIDGSINGIKYRLVLNGNTNVDSVIASGSSFDFPNQTTTGTYTVVAINTTSGCTANMSGTAVITSNSCSITFTGKLFIQGYYIGGEKMSPLLKLLGLSSDANDVDTITVELHRSSYPYDTLFTSKGILKTDGSLSCSFPGAASGSYYIAIKHRNSIETWSANAVSIAADYDFTTAANKAYGNNMVLLGNSKYGIYSGDVTQNGSINSTDKYSLEGAISTFPIGTYNVNDISGDGFVDEDDYMIMENNVPAGISAQHPN